MSKARLVVTAVVLEGRSQAEVARAYGVSESFVSRALARYREEGEGAFEPRSRRPVLSPRSTPKEVVELVVELRRDLEARGLDAGPKTIVWHLERYSEVSVSRATVARVLAREGLVVPQPRKRPRSSYIRFEAEQPNERWQADATHYTLAKANGVWRDVEILPRRPLPGDPRLQLPQDHDRPDRARGIPKSRAIAWDPGLDAHRQCQRLHDALRRRQRWT